MVCSFCYIKWKRHLLELHPLERRTNLWERVDTFSVVDTAFISVPVCSVWLALAHDILFRHTAGGLLNRPGPQPVLIPLTSHGRGTMGRDKKSSNPGGCRGTQNLSMRPVI
jgi:hypothetical protein